MLWQKTEKGSLSGIGEGKAENLRGIIPGEGEGRNLGGAGSFQGKSHFQKRM